MNDRGLRKLFEKHQCSKLHIRYDIAYEFLCGHLTDKPDARVLEIGIFEGASIKVWREWFGPRAYIAAIDISPDSVAAVHGFANYAAAGSQYDVGFLERVAVETGGGFDLIVDDGSHRPDHQWTSYSVLWPHLNDWGVYVIEDTGANIGWKADKYKTVPANLLHEKAKAAMTRRARRPPNEFICYCGMSIFIVKVPLLS